VRSSVVAEASEPARALERPLDVPSVSSGASRRSRRRTLKAGFDVVALTVAGVAVVASGVTEAWVATAIIVCLGLLAITGQYRVLAPSLSDDLGCAAAVSAISTMAAAALAAAAGGSLAGPRRCPSTAS